MKRSKEDTRIITIKGSDTIKKLEAAASDAELTDSEYVGDLIDSAPPQKRVYGKRARERHEIIFNEKLNDIITSIGPEQRDLKQKLIKLQEYGKALLWHI